MSPGGTPPGSKGGASTQIPAGEVEVTAMRAQGAGGQNVNKVSSAIHLRFDIRRSSLPDDHKARLLALRDQRITRDGVLVIKAQTHRSQDMNRAEAFGRLQELVDSVAAPPRAPAHPSDGGLPGPAPGGQEAAFGHQAAAGQGRGLIPAGSGRIRPAGGPAPPPICKKQVANACKCLILQVQFRIDDQNGRFPTARFFWPIVS